jgi:hypothetical protein
VEHLLKVFAERAMPEFDERLIGLCQHSDDRVRLSAFNALEELEHPLIREFAVAQLRAGGFDSRLIGLFVRNYEPGDEAMIFEALRLPDDELRRHTLMLDALKVVESQPEAECSPLGLLVYGESTCSQCRSFAVELLVDDGVAPAWLIEESRFDASSYCRKLALGSETED